MAVPANGPFSAYLVLITKRDQALEERGELDPQTLIAIRDQIAEDRRLSCGQQRLLVDALDNRLRRAGSGWR